MHRFKMKSLRLRQNSDSMNDNYSALRTMKTQPLANYQRGWNKARIKDVVGGHISLLEKIQRLNTGSSSDPTMGMRMQMSLSQQLSGTSA